MKTRTLRTTFISLLTVAVIAIGANAFAGKGMGSGNDDGGKGYGHHQRSGDCPYGNRNVNLTDEQRTQLDNERQAFFDATKDVRQEIRAKRLALKAELAKKDADASVALDMQKTISGLQADLDQKRIGHIMTMRKIAPDAGFGLHDGGGRGKGRHGHHNRCGDCMGNHGMGYGPGNCRQ